MKTLSFSIEYIVQEITCVVIKNVTQQNISQFVNISDESMEMLVLKNNFILRKEKVTHLVEISKIRK
jgi:hypothetical protein